MSATVPRLLAPPLPSPPVPGLVALFQAGSCAPKGNTAGFKGVPRFRPLPGIVLQFTPSVRPAVEQVALALRAPTTPLPGKERYFAAMLPEGANAAKAGVSNQPFPCRGENGSRSAS